MRDIELTIASIREFVRMAERSHIREFLTLQEWSGRATTGPDKAAEVERVIMDNGLYREDPGIHTDFEWRMIADLAGRPAEWEGYNRGVDDGAEV